MSSSPDPQLERKAKAAATRAANKIVKGAADILSNADEKEARETMATALARKVELENALLGYGVVDIFEINWIVGENIRALVKGEVNNLVKSFRKNGRLWWLEKNMISALVDLGEVVPESLTQGTPDPRNRVKFTAEADGKISVEFMEGNHRINALGLMKESLEEDLKRLESYLDKGQELLDEDTLRN